MAQLAQDKRPAQLQTPLGKDVLVLASFVATEALSELFEVNVETPAVPGVDDQVDVNYAVEEQASGSITASVDVR